MGMTLVALAIGTGLIAIVGLVHHHALAGLGRLAPDPDTAATGAIQTTFVSLVLLHVAEILTFSAANGILLAWDGFGGAKADPLGAADIIYLTGVNFTTLGYAQIKLTGDLRIVTMLQALGGFMLLTWSATYLFSVCQKSWQRNERE